MKADIELRNIIQQYRDGYLTHEGLIDHINEAKKQEAIKAFNAARKKDWDHDGFGSIEVWKYKDANEYINQKHQGQMKAKYFDLIREKFKTHVDAHTGIEIVSPYMCIEEFSDIIGELVKQDFNQFISKYPIKVKQKNGRLINNKIDINQLKFDYQKNEK